MTESGLTAMDAIIAATRTPAEILRVDDRLGTVEVGKTADLLIVPGNPVEDIRCLSYDRVELVIQGGQPLEAPRIDVSRLMGMQAI